MKLGKSKATFEFHIEVDPYHNHVDFFRFHGFKKIWCLMMLDV